MKLSLYFGILVGTALPLLAAEPFVVPSFVRELKDLETIKSEAVRENKGISFLLMEPGST